MKTVSVQLNDRTPSSMPFEDKVEQVYSISKFLYISNKNITQWQKAYKHTWSPCRRYIEEIITCKTMIYYSVYICFGAILSESGVNRCNFFGNSTYGGLQA